MKAFRIADLFTFSQLPLLNNRSPINQIKHLECEIINFFPFANRVSVTDERKLLALKFIVHKLANSTRTFPQILIFIVIINNSSLRGR